MFVSSINCSNNNVSVNNANKTNFKARSMYYRRPYKPRSLSGKTQTSESLLNSISEVLHIKPLIGRGCDCVKLWGSSGDFKGFALNDSIVQIRFQNAPPVLLLLGSRYNEGCNAVCISEKDASIYPEFLKKAMTEDDRTIEKLVDKYVTGDEDAIKQLGGEGKSFFIKTDDFMAEEDKKLQKLREIIEQNTKKAASNNQDSSTIGYTLFRDFNTIKDPYDF